MSTSTVSNPFFVDLSNPNTKKQVEKLMIMFQTRRPSTTDTKKKLVSLNSKIDKARIQFDKLMEEIPALVVEIMLWQKYQQHKEQQDQQKLSVVEEENQLRLAQLELEKKKAALNDFKRITTKRPMLEDTTPTLNDFKPISNKIQVFVVDVVGKSHPAEVVPSSTIDELFHYVFSGFKDVPKEDCALKTGTKTLELGKTFAEQGVEADSVIHMFIRQRGGGKKKYKALSSKRAVYITKPTFAASLLYANEEELDAIFEKLGGAESDGADSISLGSESERSGASEEYKRGKDPDYVPSEDEGDEGDDFDDCAHEWLNAAGICFDCGAEVGAHSTAFPTTPFQPKE